MSNSETSNIIAENLIVATTLLSQLMADGRLNKTDVANECLEVFDTVDWVARHNLTEEESARWTVLLQKGDAEDMSQAELDEFIDLSNTSELPHLYCTLKKASALLEGAEKPFDGTYVPNDNMPRDDIKVIRSMQDWRIDVGEEAVGEVVPDDERQVYQVTVQVGNQTAIEIVDAQGEPSLGVMIEINHGVPAVHIDADGSDSLVHIHKAQGGIVLTPESKFQQAEVDKFAYNETNSLRVVL